MALSVARGFEAFLGSLVPLEPQRQAAARHRGRVEASLRNALDVSIFRETGSFYHGTGVRNNCDSDLLVSLKGGRPGSSDTAIRWIKDALVASFPFTPVHVSRPAIVVDFGGGKERWEIIPGFITSRGPEGIFVYDIPGPASGWIDSAPAAHLAYVNEINSQEVIKGGAKKLARLAKAWKYYNNVPISSFYLEMRATKYISTHTSFIPVYDICGLLEHLQSIRLSAMNDPKNASGRFYACSSPAKSVEALSKVKTGASRARKALDAYRNENETSAFYNLDLLFGGRFPAR